MGAASLDLPVERLGRYDVVGLLATGGMAEILLATQRGPTGFERPVVIKRILPHLARQKVFRDMFIDEARIVSQIRHPNVVHVQELGDSGTELFLVMEYLEGESVSALIRRAKLRGEALSSRVAAHLVADACAGLHAAHELKDADGKSMELVHRDVSPHNLFVAYSGQLKVIDFGIAKSADASVRTQTGQVKGKFSYMAPEQIAAERIDRRVDVFALGAVMYELLTGKKLFDRENDLLVMKAICEQPIPPPSSLRSDVDPNLEAICLRALSRSRAQRYESAQAMRREIVAALRAMPGDDLPEEELAAIMGRLFSDRIATKAEMMRRIRAGQAVTRIPGADTNGGASATPATEAYAGPKSGTSGTASPPQVLTLQPAAQPRPRWLLALAATALIASSAVGVIIATRPAGDGAESRGAVDTTSETRSGGSTVPALGQGAGAHVESAASAGATASAIPSATVSASSSAVSKPTPPPVARPPKAPPPKPTPTPTADGFRRFD